jgi:hypothetical protein
LRKSSYIYHVEKRKKIKVMLEFTEKRRKQILELIKGYGLGYITDDECIEMCNLIEGTPSSKK